MSDHEIVLPADDLDGHCCEEMATANERNLIWLYRKDDPLSLAYGIVQQDGDVLQVATTLPLRYCPWCGDDIESLEADTV